MLEESETFLNVTFLKQSIGPRRPMKWLAVYPKFTLLLFHLQEVVLLLKASKVFEDISKQLEIINEFGVPYWYIQDQYHDACCYCNRCHKSCKLFTNFRLITVLLISQVNKYIGRCREAVLLEHLFLKKDLIRLSDLSEGVHPFYKVS